MGQRLDLQTMLEGLLGSRNVYFQPPPGFMLSYPCIVYKRSKIFTDSGDNAPYKLENQYELTVMDTNPDSEIPKKVASLSRCVFDRHFVSEGLNHDVFSIIY